MTPNGKKSRTSKAPKTSPAPKLTASDEEVVKSQDDATDAGASPSKPLRGVTGKSSKKRSPKDEHDDMPVIELVRRIGAGAVSGKSLRAAVRQDVVRYLVSDGRSTAEIAFLLNRSDRTIERDREAIKDSLTLPNDPRMFARLAGRVVHEGEVTNQQARRIASDKAVDAKTRLEAACRAFSVIKEASQTLKDMGFANGEQPQGGAELSSPEAQLAEVERILKIGAAGGIDPEDIAELRQMREHLCRMIKLSAIKNKYSGLAGDSPHAA